MTAQRWTFWRLTIATIAAAAGGALATAPITDLAAADSTATGLAVAAPAALTTPPPQAQVRAAMDFVDARSTEQGDHVFASTDWARSRIILAADPQARSVSQHTTARTLRASGLT